MEQSIDNQCKSRKLFLIIISLVYLFTFASLLAQIRGLYGDDGLYPASYVLKDKSACEDLETECEEWAKQDLCRKNAHWMKQQCPKSCHYCVGTFRKVLELPTIVWLHSYSHLSVETMMELCCIMGTVVSILVLVVDSFRDCLAFIVMWVLFSSLSQVGQVFMQTTWDSLLLETGFISIFVSDWTLFIGPWNVFYCQRLRPVPAHHKNIPFWLLQWLLFRWTLSLGVTQLWWGGAAWWDLTALHVYTEQQCLPNPLSWYWHKLSPTFHRLLLALTYLVEFGLSLFLFAPIRYMRQMTAAAVIVMHSCLGVSGNSGVLCWVVIALGLAAFDDDTADNIPTVKSIWHHPTIKSSIKRINGKSDKYEPLESEEKEVDEKPEIKKKCEHNLSTVKDIYQDFVRLVTSRSTSFVLSIATLVATILLLVNLFGMTLSKTELIQVSTKFTLGDLHGYVMHMLPLSFMLALLSLASLVVRTVISSCLSAYDVTIKGIMAVKVFCYGWCILYYFVLTLGPFVSFDDHALGHIPVSVMNQSQHTSDWRLTNSYVSSPAPMTTYDMRNEVVLFGSDNPGNQSTWKEYTFMYKPGQVNKMPSFAAPHHPRLDWQMCFAADSDYEANPWFVHLTLKLLQGSNDVIQLLEHNPFGNKPPTFIRAVLYEYHFTGSNTSFAKALFQHGRSSANWWVRHYKREYMPVVSLNDSALLAMMKQFKLTRVRNRLAHEQSPVSEAINIISMLARSVRGEVLILLLSLVVIALNMIKLSWRWKRHAISEKFLIPAQQRWQSRLAEQNQLNVMQQIMKKIPNISRKTKKDKWLPMDTKGTLDQG